MNYRRSLFQFVKWALSTSLLLLLCVGASAEVKLPGLFSDHMVLQQRRPVPVWGWARPGEKITVTLRGTTRRAITDSNGRWRVLLPVMTAGGPFNLTVSGTRTIVLKDVLVGEVWVMSGQSNMNFQLRRAKGGEQEAAAAGNYSQIRLFTVPLTSATTPQENVASSWQLCTPETAGDFSAVAYFFGKELHRKLSVPIGLIHTSWPGTTAEEWTDYASLRSDQAFARILERWDHATPDEKRRAGKLLPFSLEFDDFELVKKGSDEAASRVFSNFDDGTSRNALGGYWIYDWELANHSGFALEGPGRGSNGSSAHVSGELAAGETSLFQTTFSADGSPADLSSYAGIRFHYRGRGVFKVHSLQPTITDWDNYATSVFTAKPDWQVATVWFKDLRQAGWGKVLPFTPQSLSGLMIETLRSADDDNRPASALFNGMIAPLIPYAIRGAGWYQGESNATRAAQYRKLLPAMIRGWRRAWGEGDFPFLIVQLPNYGSPEMEPGESWWAELREAQLQTLNVLPNTGLAVTIDIGEADDVHPQDKMHVGQRLAAWAIGTTYAQPGIYSGPLYESAQPEGDAVRIWFRHTGGRLITMDGRPLRGFAIAGADRKFRRAEARIDGDTIVVSSPDVPSPIAARYAWAGNPECNLTNLEGLPASPFRTDSWPVSTETGQN